MTPLPTHDAPVIADGSGLEPLQSLLGPKGFCNSVDAMTPWLTDWRGKYHGRAAALLSPATVEEVQYILRFANAHRIALVPQGGNSGMVAGATPDDSGTSLILSLRRMNRIRAIDSGARQVVAEAGVILQHLHEEVAEEGLRFPLTLGGKGSATVGGLVSTNAGGTQVLRHGPMRSLVLGLEAVLPDSSLHSSLAALRKDNRGYNLDQLLIGAEGTLGIVTAATLKLVPAVTARHVVWAATDSPHQALAALRRLEALLGDAVEGFEIIPGSALASVVAHIPDAQAPLAPHNAWHILVEAVESGGTAQTIASALETGLAALIEEGVLRDAVIAKNEREADAMWRLRDSVSESERALGPALQHDISVPVERMPDFLTQDATAIAAQFPGVTMMGFGHLGDGNIHLHAKPPRDAQDRGAAWLAAHGEAVSEAIYRRVIAAGGSISAEHGIGRAKRAYFHALDDPARIAALRAIKQALDPNAILNPGVLV